MYSILVSFRDTDNGILFLQMFEIKIHGLSSVILNLNIFTLTKSKCACTDGWVTDERRPYIMMPLRSICIFKWSLKGPGVWILLTCKGMKWKWCSDNIGLYFLGRNVWPAALWNHLCGFGLKPPPLSPRVLRDSVLKPHNQVNACFERIWAQRILDPLAWMSAVFCLPSIHSSYSDGHTPSRLWVGAGMGMMCDTWPGPGQPVDFLWLGHLSQDGCLTWVSPKKCPSGTWFGKMRTKALSFHQGGWAARVEFEGATVLFPYGECLPQSKSHQWYRPCV